jgi:NTP pyrophosphatase (non-canonical NTP hydrolase)
MSSQDEVTRLYKRVEELLESNNRYQQAARDARSALLNGRSFQDRVVTWYKACFGQAVLLDPVERRDRFFEEALELVQAAGMSKADVHVLVDYVYGRPVGDVAKEAGQVLGTIAGLCTAHDIIMAEAGEQGLNHAWANIDKIRAKRATKPGYGPMPGTSDPA